MSLPSRAGPPRGRRGGDGGATRRRHRPCLASPLAQRPCRRNNPRLPMRRGSGLHLLLLLLVLPAMLLPNGVFGRRCGCAAAALQRGSLAAGVGESSVGTGEAIASCCSSNRPREASSSCCGAQQRALRNSGSGCCSQLAGLDARQVTPCGGCCSATVLIVEHDPVSPILGASEVAWGDALQPCGLILWPPSAGSRASHLAMAREHPRPPDDDRSLPLLL